MILITGTNIDVSQLPNSSMVEYQIENERMDIKLKTIAKSPSCFHIYIAEDKRAEYTVTDSLLEKLTYFSSDEELIRFLERGTEPEDPFVDPPSNEGNEQPETPPEFPPPTVEPPTEVKDEKKPEKKPNSSKSIDFTKPDEAVDEKEQGGSQSLIPKVDIVEVPTQLPDEFLVIPNLGEDIDSLKVQLDNKDRQIAQKEGTIKELRREIDQIYKSQELELKEVQDSLNAKIQEFKDTISVLETKISTGSLDEQATQFLKYINYANGYKGVSREEFSAEEKERMGKLTSDIHIFATAGGESTKSMFSQIKALMTKGCKSIIVDFTNDVTLSAMLKLNQGTHSMSLVNDDVNPVTLLKDVSGTNYIPSTSFNDIAFLAMDWPKVIKKINEMAGGKDIILLFGDINNFNVRTTISKLATIGELQIFVKCNPIIFTEFYHEISFIPKERVNIVAVDYIDVIKPILSSISNNYKVQAFASQVEWKKIGIK